MQYKPHHAAISVNNLNDSLNFYKSLGFEQVHRFDEEDDSLSIVHLKLNSFLLEVFAYTSNKDKPAKNFGYANNLEDIGVKHLALSTDNVEAALDDLRNKGIADNSTKIEESTTKRAKWFFIKDPNGIWVEIIKDDRYS